MTTLTEYFSTHSYKNTYYLGDRVRGFWHGIPFSGTVAIDTLVSEQDGCFILVNTDLPIHHDNVMHTMIKVTHADILKPGNKYDISSKTNSKKSKMGGN